MPKALLSLLVIAFGVLGSQRLVAQSHGVYFYADALGHSDISSVEQVSDLEELDGEFHRGEFVFSKSSAGFGYQLTLDKTRIGLGAFTRFIGVFDFNEDASEVFSTAMSRGDLEYGRRYELDFEFYKANAQGVELFFDRQASKKLRYSAKLQAFSASGLLDGRLETFIVDEGNITSVGGYEFYYNSDPILKRRVTPSKGKGASIDVAVHYAFSDKVMLDLSVEDAYSHIEWPDAPITIANINAQSTALVDKRKIIQKASISGREFYEDFENEIPSTYRAQVSYRRDQRKWYASGVKAANFSDLHVGFVDQRGGFDYFLGASPLYGNIEMGIQLGKYRASLALEDIDVFKTDYFVLNLSRSFDLGISRFDSNLTNDHLEDY